MQWSKKDLKRIWQQVPVDYYDKGISNNLLQKIWHKNKFKNFRELIGNNNSYKKIIDVGCAGGHMTNEISLIFPHSQVFGVDVYSPVLKFAKHKYPQIIFKKADAHKIPFSANHFDLVVCYETIEHVADPQKVLAEIYRITKKNGRAVIAMDSGSWIFRIVWWVWEKTKGSAWKNAHLHPFAHKELEILIADSGLKILQKHFSHMNMEVIFITTK